MNRKVIMSIDRSDEAEEWGSPEELIEVQEKVLMRTFDDANNIKITDEHTFIEKFPLAVRLYSIGFPRSLIFPPIKWRKENEKLKYISNQSRKEGLKLGFNDLLHPLSDCINSAKRLNLDMTKIIIARCEEGEWDIDHADGEMLALAVLEAQDFYLLRTMGAGFWTDVPDKVSNKIWTAILKWAEKTNQIHPKDWSSEASNLVYAYSYQYEIPHKEKLPIVADGNPAYWWNWLISKGIKQQALERKARFWKNESTLKALGIKLKETKEEINT